MNTPDSGDPDSAENSLNFKRSGFKKEKVISRLYRSMRGILSTDSGLARTDRSPVSKTRGLGFDHTAHDLAGPAYLGTSLTK